MTTDVAFIERVHDLYTRFREQAARRIVGQADVLEELFLALISGGHVLLEGVPGLGKTLMVRTLAESLSLEFQRVQCTPDLMPGDITGSEMLLAEAGTSCGMTAGRGLQFVKGPVFTNILLADEMNRTPPRTQSALLEAMQEEQVTVGRVRHALPRPFFVLATQNPIEQEGTYPLPEAQLDRFMFNSRVTYPSREEEIGIFVQQGAGAVEGLEPILGREELLDVIALVRRVPVSGELTACACDLCRWTRPGNETDPPALGQWVRKYVAWGAGPRAGLALLAAARARAVVHGRLCVERADLRALAPSVLRHRVQMRFTANAEGITPDDVVAQILEKLP